MSFRLWHRIRIASGVTLNLSKATASRSFGPRDAKFAVSPRCNRATAGLPGTGLFCSVHEPRRASATQAQRIARRDRLNLGLFQRRFTPADERALIDGLRAAAAGDEGAALAEFPKAAGLPDATGMAGMLWLRREEFEAALRGLDRVPHIQRHRLCRCPTQHSVRAGWHVGRDGARRSPSSGPRSTTMDHAPPLSRMCLQGPSGGRSARITVGSA